MWRYLFFVPFFTMACMFWLIGSVVMMVGDGIAACGRWSDPENTPP